MWYLTDKVIGKTGHKTARKKIIFYWKYWSHTSFTAISWFRNFRHQQHYRKHETIIYTIDFDPVIPQTVDCGLCQYNSGVFYSLITFGESKKRKKYNYMKIKKNKKKILVVCLSVCLSMHPVTGQNNYWKSLWIQTQFGGCFLNIKCNSGTKIVNLKKKKIVEWN